jgi:hypothetical protein
MARIELSRYRYTFVVSSQWQKLMVLWLVIMEHKIYHGRDRMVVGFATTYAISA